MFNKELMLMGPSSYTIYKITVEEAMRGSTHYLLGYNSITALTSPFGALDPLYLHISGKALEITRAYHSMYLSGSLNRPYFYLGFSEGYPSNTAYLVRLDTKKGIYDEPIVGRDIIEFIFEPGGEPFFTEEDIGKTIELYISDAPPPFDWEKISM